MGVRGLTTFIAKHSHKYLEPYKLHDTYLVIDGYNIASHLYKWHCTRNDCFGGDYDKYAKIVLEFFELLKECNITPLIVFDGGYETRKLKTVYQRMRNKIKMARSLTSVTEGNVTVFPLFLRELFTDIVINLGIKVVRCDFEADYEMACLARSLNVPVLSYDSDFYVFDVLYIPFSTVSLNRNKIKNSSVYYIHCKIYKVETFLKSFGSLQKYHLPLIALLLGNDYIKRKVFKNFYAHINLPKKKKLESQQQRRIAAISKWLGNETYESAVKKILSRLKTQDRKNVAEQIKIIAEGYNCVDSKLLHYLDIDVSADTKVLDTKSDFNIDFKVSLEEIESCDEPEDESDGSDSSSSNSSACSGLEINELNETVTDLFNSDNFTVNFRKAIYPSPFKDLVTRNTYFCMPQLEDYSEKCSHLISSDIVGVIHKILTSDEAENLTFVARSDQNHIQHYIIESDQLHLPKLNDLENLSKSTAQEILLDVLGLKQSNIVELLKTFPSSWMLYYLSVLFWIKSLSPKINIAYIYSIILCSVVLYKIDKQIGFYRSTTKFLNKFQNELNIETEHQLDVSSSSVNHLDALLNNISRNESLFCMKELLSYFQMDPKMRSRQKLYDINIIHLYAQFQSCLLHIKYLNTLLMRPFENVLVSDFYDGTFLYNMSSNLLKRNDVNVYLDTLLKHCPVVLKICSFIGEKIFSCSNNYLNCTTTNVKQKRRRKRKQKSNSVGENLIGSNSGSESDFVDINNPFSLLNIVNK